MTPDSPFSADRNRRDFVKKSLAASIIAAQPTILAGLVRAQGGGGGGTTAPWETTAPWQTTEPWETLVDTTDWGSSYDTTDWDGTGIETTEVETTEPVKIPALVKKNPAGVNSNGICPVTLKTKETKAGNIVVTEKRDGVDHIVYQAKVYFKLETELELPKPTDGEASLKKAECFKCTAKNTKLSFEVVKTDGTAGSLAGQIAGNINNRLGISFNPAGSPSKPYLYIGDLTHGVSATAMQHPDNASAAYLSAPNPNSKESPEGHLRVKLSPNIAPGGKEASKTVEWTFEPSSGPSLTDTIKKAITDDAKAAAQGHESDWVLTMDFPAFEFEAPASKPTQAGQAGKAVESSVKDGAGCPVE